MMPDAVADPTTFAAVVPAPAAAVAPQVPGQPNVVNVHYQNPTGTITPAPAGPAPLPTTVIEQLQAYGALQARVAQMEAESRSREDAARAEHAKILIAKGHAEDALNLTREQAKKDLDAAIAQKAQTEERAKRHVLTGTLAQELARHNLVPGGAEQLTKIWQENFVVEPKGESFEVRTTDYQQVGTFIGAMLGRPEFTHYLRATTAGGVGAPGASASAPTPTSTQNVSTASEGKDIGEALIAKTLKARKAMNPHPHLTGGSAFNSEGMLVPMAAAPFGLRAPL